MKISSFSLNFPEVKLGNRWCYQKRLEFSWPRLEHRISPPLCPGFYPWGKPSLHHNFSVTYLQTRTDRESLFCSFSFCTVHVKSDTLFLPRYLPAFVHWCCVSFETCPGNQRYPVFCPRPSGCPFLTLVQEKKM